jgi:hypothetical protein
LPPQGVALVQQLDGTFSVGLGPHKRYRQHRETIDRLTRAIADATTVQIRYDSASRGRTTRREVDPYRLWYATGGLYLIAYCHLRREPRMFAVERIKSVTPTDHPYQMPLHFDLDAFVQDALTVMRGPRIEVELEFNKATAAWVKGSSLARHAGDQANQRRRPADDSLRGRYPRTDRVGAELRQRGEGPQTRQLAGSRASGSATDREPKYRPISVRANLVCGVYDTKERP